MQLPDCPFVFRLSPLITGNQECVLQAPAGSISISLPHSIVCGILVHMVIFFKKISLTKVMLFTPFWFQTLKILDSKMSVNILRIVPETIYTLVKHCKISHSTVTKRLCILIVLHLSLLQSDLFGHIFSIKHEYF
jgi:hypothetical protein